MDLIQEGVWTNQSNRNEIWDGRIDDPNMAIWVSKIRKPKIKILLLKDHKWFFSRDNWDNFPF